MLVEHMFVRRRRPPIHPPCTQAGKTTLLNCLASVIPARERVVTCEEVFELGKTAA